MPIDRKRTFAPISGRKKEDILYSGAYGSFGDTGLSGVSTAPSLELPGNEIKPVLPDPGKDIRLDTASITPYVSVDKDEEKRRKADRKKVKEQINLIDQQNRRTWREQAAKILRGYREEWREKWKQEHGKYPDDKFETRLALDTVRAMSGRFAEETMNVHGWAKKMFQKGLGKIGAKDQRIQSQIERMDFARFLIEKERERVSGLADEEFMKEVQLGGIYAPGSDKPWEFLQQMFFKSAASGMTYGLVDKGDPIYGEAIRQRESVADTLGTIYGELATTLTMTQGLTAANVPGMITRFSTGGPIRRQVLGTALRLAGKPRLAMKKLPVIFNWTKNAAEFGAYAAPEAIGAAGLTIGFARATNDQLKSMMQLYQNEWKIPDKDWKKYVAQRFGKVGEEFLTGYGIQLINDPRGVPFRMLFDTIFSAGQQGKDILLGRQDGWDWKSYLVDFGVGNLMGEIPDIASGIFFKPSVDMMSRQFHDARRREIANMLVENGYIKNLKDAWKPTEDLFMAGRLYEEATGKPVSREKFFNLVREFGVGYKEQYKVFHGTKYPDFIELTGRDIVKPMPSRSIDEAYSLIKRRTEVPDAAINIMREGRLVENGDVDGFVQAMRDIDRVAKDKIDNRDIVEKLDALAPMSMSKAMRKFHEALMRVDNLKDKYAGKSAIDAMRETRNLFGPRKVEPERTSLDAFEEITSNAGPERKAAEDRVKRLMEAVFMAPDKLIRKDIVDPGLTDEPMDIASDVLVRWLENPPAKITDMSEKEIISFFNSALKNEFIDRVRKTSGRAETPAEEIASIEEKERLIREGKPLPKKKPSKKTVSLFDINPHTGEERLAGMVAKPEGAGDPSKIRVNRQYLHWLTHRIRQGNLRSIQQSAAFYLKHFEGMSNAEIANRFMEWGNIKSSEAAVAKMLQDARKTMAAEIDEVPEVVYTKQQFSEKELRSMFEEAVDRNNELNPRTGLPSRFTPIIVENIDRYGGYVMDMDAVKKSVSEVHGDIVADRVINKAAAVINDLLNEARVAFERPELEIGVVNPTAENSTKFVFWKNDGISANEFNETISYIHNVLANNYDEAIDYVKRFTVFVRDVEGDVDIITDFKGIETKMIDGVDDTVGDVMMFDNDLPSWKRIQEDSEGTMVDDVQPELSDDLRNTAEQIKQPDFEKSINDIIGEEAPQMTGLQMGFQEANITMARGIRDRVRGKVGAFKKNARAVNALIESATNVWEGVDKLPGGMNLEMRIYEASALPRRSNQWAKSIMDPFVQRFITDRGYFKEGLSLKKFRRFDMLFLLGREMESGRILKEKISPEKLMEPINWHNEKTNRMKGFDIASLKQSLIRNQWDLNTFVHQKLDYSVDPLFYSKFITQVVGIKPKDLFEMYDTMERVYGPAQESLYKDVDKDGPTMGDRYLNLAEKIKEEYRDKIYGALEQYTNLPDPKSIEIDTPDGYKAAETAFKSIPDAKMREDWLTWLENYRDVDPDTWRYVHHIPWSDKDNVRVWRTHVEKIRTGETITGTDALGIDPKAMKGRKFATIEGAIRAGFKVRNVGLIESMYSTFSYLKTTQYNKAWLDGMKESFMNSFVAAQKTGDVEQFFDDNVGAWFYKPSSAEIKKLQGQIGEYNAAIKEKINTGDTAAADDLSNVRDNILKKLDVMSQLNAAWNEYFPKLLQFSQDMTMKYIPLNKNSFIGDNEMFDEMAQAISIRHSDNTRSAYSVPGGEGIFFIDGAYQGLRQFVFRDNFWTNKNVFVKNFFRKVYDPVNTSLKIMSLSVKPWILWTNGLMQGGISNPFYVTKMKQGIMDYAKRDVRGSWENFMWSEMDNRELFNEAIPVPQAFSDSYKAIHDVLGKNAMLGKVFDTMTGNQNAIKKMSDIVIKNNWQGVQRIAWAGDKINRLMLAEQFFPIFLKGQTGSAYKGMTVQKIVQLAKNNKELHVKIKKALDMTAHKVNSDMVQYTRIANYKRQAYNRLIGFPTFWTGTGRMYLNHMKQAGIGIARIFGKDLGDGKFKFMWKEWNNIYKYSDNKWKQIFYEVMPLFNYTITRGALFGAMMATSGYGFDSLLDALTDYRLKKKSGDDFMDTEMRIISMSTPVNFFQKYYQRSRNIRTLLFFNLARLPGLCLEILNNKSMVTQEPIFKDNAGFKENSLRLGMHIASQYFPFGSDISGWSSEDLSLFEKILRTTGFGFAYSTGSPNEWLRDLKRATNERSSAAEKMAAQRIFWTKMNRASKKIMNKYIPTWDAIINQAAELMNKTEF